MAAICHLPGIYRYGVVGQEWVVEAADKKKELKYENRCRTATLESLHEPAIEPRASYAPLVIWREGEGGLSRI